HRHAEPEWAARIEVDREAAQRTRELIAGVNARGPGRPLDVPQPVALEMPERVWCQGRRERLGETLAGGCEQEDRGPQIALEGAELRGDAEALGMADRAGG